MSLDARPVSVHAGKRKGRGEQDTTDPQEEARASSDKKGKTAAEATDTSSKKTLQPMHAKSAPDALGHALRAGMRDLLQMQPAAAKARTPLWESTANGTLKRVAPDPMRERLEDYIAMLMHLGTNCSASELEETVRTHSRAMGDRLPVMQDGERKALFKALGDTWVAKQRPLTELARLLAAPASTLSFGAVLGELVNCAFSGSRGVVEALATTPLEASELDALAETLRGSGQSSEWFTALVRQVGLTPQAGLVRLLQVERYQMFPVELLQYMDLQEATLEGVAAVGHAFGASLGRPRVPLESISSVAGLPLKRLSPERGRALLESVVSGLGTAGGAAVTLELTRMLVRLRETVGDSPRAEVIDDVGRSLVGTGPWEAARRLGPRPWNHPLRFSPPAGGFPAERVRAIFEAALQRPATPAQALPPEADLYNLNAIPRPLHGFMDWVEEGVKLGHRCQRSGMSETEFIALLAQRLAPFTPPTLPSLGDSRHPDPITAGLLLGWGATPAEGVSLALRAAAPFGDRWGENSLARLRVCMASLAWSQPQNRDALIAALPLIPQRMLHASTDGKSSNDRTPLAQPTRALEWFRSASAAAGVTLSEAYGALCGGRPTALPAA